jgi:ATP-dependent helicase/nuclease subunit B
MNLFYITPESNFLLELVNGISKRFPNIELSKLTILLPSRRSCNQLADLFINQNKGPILLPKIIPIGDMEESEILPSDLIDDFDLTIPPSFTSTEQLLHLANELNNMPLIKAIDIVHGLNEFLKRLHRDELSVKILSKISFGDVPQHVTTLIEYLHLLAVKWPQITKLYNKLDFIERRNLQINKRIENWQKNEPEYPIIAAGSNGSIKSTAKLLKTLIKMSNGYVVLRGIDPGDDQENWLNIDCYHPLFYLKSLISDIGANYQDLKPWSRNQTNPTVRHKFLQEVMRPATMVDKWQKLNPQEFVDLQNFEIIQCQSQYEEATVIALKLREVLLDNNKTVAVVSSDHNLLTKLRSIMCIWDVNLNCSYGALITDTAQIGFLKLIIDVINDFSAVNILSLFKHEYFYFNYLKSELSDLISKLELKYFRRVCSFTSLQELIGQVKARGDIEIAKLLTDFAVITQEFYTKLQQPKGEFYDLLSLHISLAEKLATSKDQDGIQVLWGNEIGEIVGGELNEIISYAKILDYVGTKNYWQLFLNLIQGKKYYPSTTNDFPITLLSSIESRLLYFDVVILASFNEGVWPANIEINPWFNSATCYEIGLTPEEYKIGLTAHDFYCLAHMPEVLITRSTKVGGSPTTPSRWLIRLEALLGKISKLEQVKPNRHKLQYWAEKLFLPPESINYQPEMPKPPVDFRPKELSVTQVEKLMRDPYGFYADKILKLKPLEPIDKEPDQRDFGNFVHFVIDAFNKQFTELNPTQYLPTLLNLAEQQIKHIINRPIIHQIWLPRFTEIAKWLVEFEKIRRNNPNKKIYSEIKGKFVFTTKYGSCAVKAKADRIETENGLVTIMDFKTGIIPTNVDILIGHSPQLILEGLIAEKEGFIEIIQGNANHHLIVQELIYAQLASGNKLGKLTTVKADVRKLLQAAEEGIKKLFEIYLDENTAYIICPNNEQKPSYNEYEHLERLEEWL